ncbi:Uma2 family endonuclease [bacterium]|nr:Uma2 family endonuclease [bacterium]
MSTATILEKKRANFTYEDYLIWDIGPDKRYELIGGEILMVPSPDMFHQTVSIEIEFRIKQLLEKTGLGRVFDAPCDVVLSSENIVQPDIIFIARENLSIITKENIKGSPDLLIEIISKKSAQRDRIIKKRLYEKRGVKEYWLVDPDRKEIEVLTLKEGVYEIYGLFKGSDMLTSSVLEGFCLKVGEVF